MAEHLKFEPFDKDYLIKSWQWLKDKEISYLIMGPQDLTIQQQQSWFQSLKTKKNYFIFGVKFNTKKIGVCGLKNIENEIGEYWGYIGEKNYWNKGIGQLILIHIIKFAKMKLNLKRLYLYVRIENKHAIKLYKKLNFKIINQTRKHNIAVLKMELNLNNAIP